MGDLSPTTPSEIKTSICSDVDMCSIVSNGDFVYVIFTDDGDMILHSDSGSIEPKIERKIKNWVSESMVSNPGAYCNDELYRIDLDNKILLYKILNGDKTHVLAGYMINKDSTTRIKLMDVVQRRLIRALK